MARLAAMGMVILMVDGTTTQSGWGELLASGRMPRLALFCLGVWLHAADTLLAATTMPSAVEEIGGVAYISWTIALYQLGSIIAGALTGLFSARHGLRRTTIGAALVYGVGCAISAVAPDMATMLSGRLMQGLGGGCLVAVAFVAAGQLFPDRLIPLTMAVISGIWGASALCGPLIGGAFANAGLWRLAYWAFAFQAFVLILAALLLLKSSPEVRAEATGRAPLRRLALLSIAVLAIAAAGAEVAPGYSGILCLAGLSAFCAFFHLDSKASDPLFPSGVLNISSTVGAGLIMVLVFGMTTMSFIVYGPLLLQVLYNTDPLTAGYMIAIESVAWTVAAIAFSSASPDHERRIITGGGALITAGLIGFAVTVPAGSFAGMAICAAASGAGFGMSWGFIVRRVVAAVKPEDREIASSALPTTQMLGYAIGSAATGIVANAAGFADGVTVASARDVSFWVFAVFIPFAFIGNFAAWQLTRKTLPA